jgi:hypothetical protein
MGDLMLLTIGTIPYAASRRTQMQNPPQSRRNASNAMTFPTKDGKCAARLGIFPISPQPL